MSYFTTSPAGRDSPGTVGERPPPVTPRGSAVHPAAVLPTAILPVAHPLAPADHGQRPTAVIGGVEYPLTRDDRPDAAGLTAVAAAFAAGEPVDLRLDGLFALVPIQADRLIDALADVLEDHCRPGDGSRLFADILDLDPGTDSFRVTAWRRALLRAAAVDTVADFQAAEFARRIATRAKDIGAERCQPHRLRGELLAMARKRLRGPPMPPEPGTALTHPSVGYGTPLDYVLGRYADKLWHDGGGTAYATVDSRHLRVGSQAWDDWLRDAWLEGHLRALKDDELRTATATVGAKARKGPAFPVYTRVARHDGFIYVDLGNAEGEVVRIGSGGWEVVTDVPVKFARGPHAAALPRPERGGSLEDLRAFVNLTPAGFVILVAALLDALKGAGDYLVVVVRGERGSAKSMLVRLVVRLVDPRPLRGPADTSDLPGPPDAKADLAAAAVNHHLLAYDNVSRVTDDMADEYCRVATGGGRTTRKLYTDGDAVRQTYCCPLWINGIPDLVRRTDLADRVAFVDAQRVTAPRPVGKLLAEFEAARPRLLGALYDALAGGLAREAAGLPDGFRPHRMAATAEWVCHCFAALGLDYGSWRDGVAAAQEDVAADITAGSEVAQALRGWFAGVTAEVPYTNTAAGWREALLAHCPAERQRFFPGQPNQFSGQLRQVAPALRAEGIEVVFAEGDRKVSVGGRNRGRAITVTRKPVPAAGEALIT